MLSLEFSKKTTFTLDETISSILKEDFVLESATCNLVDIIVNTSSWGYYSKGFISISLLGKGLNGPGWP